MEYSAIRNHLKTKEYYPIYLLHGPESFFIDEITKHLEENILTEQEKSFNQLVVYGQDTDVEGIIGAARRYPMMSKYQVVIVKEAQNIRDISRLHVYAEKPLKSTILVINHKEKKIPGTTKLVKAIQKCGIVFSSDKIRDYKIPRWIEQHVAGKGYKIQGSAVQLLADHLGQNLSQIANELDKLMLNIGEVEEITQQHITDNIGINRDYNVFEFQKALIVKNQTKVYRIADYFASNPKAAPFVVILAILYRFFSKLWVFYQVRRKREAEIMEALQVRNRFALQDYQKGVNHYTIHQVKRAIRLLHEYDLKLKGVNNVGTKEGELLRELSFQLMV